MLDAVRTRVRLGGDRGGRKKNNDTTTSVREGTEDGFADVSGILGIWDWSLSKLEGGWLEGVEWWP